jgi:hypothetical protein
MLSGDMREWCMLASTELVAQVMCMSRLRLLQTMSAASSRSRSSSISSHTPPHSDGGMHAVTAPDLARAGRAGASGEIAAVMVRVHAQELLVDLVVDPGSTRLVRLPASLTVLSPPFSCHPPGAYISKSRPVLILLLTCQPAWCINISPVLSSPCCSHATCFVSRCCPSILSSSPVFKPPPCWTETPVCTDEEPMCAAAVREFAAHDRKGP